MTYAGTGPIPILETSALADVLDEIGLPNQAVCPSIAPAHAHALFAGWAACASYAPRQAHPGTKSKDDFNAIDALAAPGQVVVLGLEGSAQGAVLGGLMAREFVRRGAAGVVTTAPVRDLSEIRQLQFSVYAKGVSPVNGARRLQVASIGQPVELPGANGVPIQVCPGDLMVGDADGLMVVPWAIAFDVAAATREVTRIEREIVQAIDQGTPRVEAMANRPRFNHLAALRDKLASMGLTP